jgi:hypothetical protein
MATQQNPVQKIIGDKNAEIPTSLQHRDGQQHNCKQPKNPFPFGGSFGYSESRYKQR